MVKPCIKCGIEAVIFIATDPDIKGVPVCDDCIDEVGTSLLLLTMYDGFDREWFKDKYGSEPPSE